MPVFPAKLSQVSPDSIPAQLRHFPGSALTRRKVPWLELLGVSSMKLRVYTEGCHPVRHSVPSLLVYFPKPSVA